jgi:hypothetical protein
LGIVGDGGDFGGEVDARVVDAVELADGLLDAADAGRAGHAADVERADLGRLQFGKRGHRVLLKCWSSHRDIG